jgi:hypothetical protein
MQHLYLRRGDSNEDVNYPWCVPIQRQVLPEASDLNLNKKVIMLLILFHEVFSLSLNETVDLNTFCFALSLDHYTFILVISI